MVTHFSRPLYMGFFYPTFFHASQGVVDWTKGFQQGQVIEKRLRITAHKEHYTQIFLDAWAHTVDIKFVKIGF